MRERTGLGVSLASAYAVAGVGGAVSAPAVQGWYRTLDLPDWRPPDSAFGPVWTALYGSMATSAWLVWRDGRRAGQPRELELRVYGVQLLLNLAWTLVFFGLRRPGLALLEIAALWVSIAATMAVFWRRHRVAALLLAPYLLWVSLATALNASIWRRNR